MFSLQGVYALQITMQLISKYMFLYVCIFELITKQDGKNQPPQCYWGYRSYENCYIFLFIVCTKKTPVKELVQLLLNKGFFWCTQYQLEYILAMKISSSTMYSLQGVYALCIMITDFKINIFLSSPNSTGKPPMRYQSNRSYENLVGNQTRLDENENQCQHHLSVQSIIVSYQHFYR